MNNCMEKINRLINTEFDQQIKNMNDEKHNNNFTYYRVTSDIVKKYSIGACSHQSSVIFTYFLENLHLLKSKENDFPKIDVMYIHNGNHVFIVLGRNIDSDPSDYKN